MKTCIHIMKYNYAEIHTTWDGYAGITRVVYYKDVVWC